jgi:autotransporter-associated beta strand protein
MKYLTTQLVLSVVAVLPFFTVQQRCVAESAAWATQPINSDWSTAQNWTPPVVPNASGDTASFGRSAITNVTLSAIINIGSLEFSRGANAFTVTAEPATNLIFDGLGIVNASEVVQNFVGVRNGGFGGGFYFFGNAAAGKNTVFTTAGNPIFFNDSSTADRATFIITNDPGISGGDVIFFGSSSAAEATFIITTAGTASFEDTSTAANALFTASGGMYGPGYVEFGINASAGNAVINCSAGGDIAFTEVATADHARMTAAGAASTAESQTRIEFIGGSTAANSRITLTGGSAAGAAGAIMNLFDGSTAGAAQITVNGGTNGGDGASVVFYSKSDGGTATFNVSDNAQIDISKNTRPTVGIGSLQGSGQVFLGARSLTIGSNNRNTVFSGVLQDGGLSGKTGGKVVKIGSGTLTLSGANTYTGGTTLNAGTLTVANTSGSATGTGALQMNAGNLTGSGVIAGAVNVGSGSGPGALLAPGLNAKNPVVLTIQSGLTFKADGTLQERLSTQRAQTDTVVADGVTISAGAQFTLQAIGRKRLTSGLVLTLISNTSANPISGTFANLADESVLTVGRNQLKVSYQGGDGNDLTLTVQ